MFVMPFAPEYLPLDVAHSALIVLCVLVGVFGAVLQSSIFGFANFFHSPRYTQAVMTGNGIVGVATSVMRMYTKYQMGNEADGLYSSSRLFFNCGATFMAVVSNEIIVFIYQSHVKDSKYHQRLIYKKPSEIINSLAVFLGMLTAIKHIA